MMLLPKPILLLVKDKLTSKKKGTQYEALLEKHEENTGNSSHGHGHGEFEFGEV
jgi:hypothetical protein